MTAYSIGGSNYVKLRDIGKAVDFGVTYGAAAAGESMQEVLADLVVSSAWRISLDRRSGISFCCFCSVTRLLDRSVRLISPF